MNYLIVAISVILFFVIIFDIIVLIDNIKAENKRYAKRKAELDIEKKYGISIFNVKL